MKRDHELALSTHRAIAAVNQALSRIEALKQDNPQRIELATRALLIIQRYPHAFEGYRSRAPSAYGRAHRTDAAAGREARGRAQAAGRLAATHGPKPDGQGSANQQGG